MLKKSFLMGAIILFMNALLFAEDSKNSDALMREIPGDPVQRVRVFHQDIAFHPSKEFGANCVHRSEKNGYFRMEFIPAGQQLSTWQDMFTIQGFSDFAMNNGMSAERLMAAMRQNLYSLAASSSYFREIYKGDINGYPGVIVLMGVKGMPVDMDSALAGGAGEIGLYLFLKGARDMYIIHRSWKTEFPYTDEKLPMGEEELGRWVALLKQVHLTGNPGGG